MKTKIIIGAVLLVCAGAAAAFYYFKKKNVSQNEETKKDIEDLLPASNVDNTEVVEQVEDLAVVKEAVVDSITDRHQEAGQYIRQTVGSIVEGKRNTKETKFDDELNSIMDKLQE